MANHRTHSIAFKRQVVQEYLAGETLHGLARRHELSRTLFRIWVDKYEAGAFDEDAEAASMIQEYEARIAALERLVGKQALELEFLKGGAAARTAAEKRAHVRCHRPRGLSIAQWMPTDGDRAFYLICRTDGLGRRHRPGRGHARDQG